MRLEHPASCGGEVVSSVGICELRIRNFGFGGILCFAFCSTRMLCVAFAVLECYALLASALLTRDPADRGSCIEKPSLPAGHGETEARCI